MKLILFLKSILKEKFFLSSSILFFATFIGNLASYFYQFAMSRLMSPADFGVLNSILSLFAIETVPVSVVSLVIVRYVAQFHARQEMGKLRLFFLNSLRNLSYLGLGLGLVIWFTRSWVGRFLHLESTTPIMILAVMIFFAFVFPVASGYLQGLQLFARLGGVSITGGVARLIFGAVLVYCGLGVNGALLANLLTLLPMMIFFYQPVRDMLREPVTGQIERHTKEILSYSLPVTLAFLGSTGLVFLDLVLVKHFFDPNMAGQYSAAVVLGRSIFYFPGALAMAMFPMVSEAQALNQSTHNLLRKCLLVTGILSSSAVILFFLAPDFLIRMLFGDQYPQASSLLPLYGLAMLPLALVNVLSQYCVAVKRYDFIYLLLGALILEYLLIYCFHGTLSAVLIILNVVEWLLFMGLMYTIFFSRKRSSHRAVVWSKIGNPSVM